MSMKLIIICLLVAVAVCSSMEAPEPEQVVAPCPTVWRPVCGTDGNTYPNEMCMKGSDPSLEVAYDGDCLAPL